MFSNDLALYTIDFIQQLKHTKGRWAGKPFELLPWQYDTIAEAYGTLNEHGLRQYQYIYLEIPKKNGKSELGAAIALYHLFADGEVMGEIYGCAGDKQQASLVFDVACAMIDQNPMLKKRAKVLRSRKEIHDRLTGSIYKVLAAEAPTKHGLNVSCVIFDEIHAQPNRELWDVMTGNSGDSRTEPMWYVITTAGDDPDRTSIGWEIHEKARKIIAGELVDPRWYCKIWGLEPDFEGDIYDEALWYRLNPSLGYTIDIEKVRQAAIGARNSEAEERLFRWLRLNQWMANKAASWLPLTLWDQNTEDVKLEDLIGKRCYAGLDLSSVVDLSGLAYVFPPQEGLPFFYVLFEAFMPEDGMRQRERDDKVPFSRWVRGGYLHATPGDVIDYDFIRATIVRQNGVYKIKEHGNDPWGAEKLRQDLMREERPIELTEVRQNISAMSPTMKEIERLLRIGKLKHGANPLARWCFGNTKVVMDGNENYKPQKIRSTGRIDLTVAMINAMYVLIKNEGTPGSVYERRGIITV